MTSETNTYKNNTDNTPLHFWRDELTWRSTNTGMNQNVIGNKVPYAGKREYLDQHIDSRIYHTSIERLKRKSFVETVNGCLSDIYSCGRGYVFTDDQLSEVKRILPRVRSGWSNENCCYSCRR